MPRVPDAEVLRLYPSARFFAVGFMRSPITTGGSPPSKSVNDVLLESAVKQTGVFPTTGSRDLKTLPIYFMCSGVVPQQPPSMRTPISTSLGTTEVMSSGEDGKTVSVPRSKGIPAFGCAISGTSVTAAIAVTAFNMPYAERAVCADCRNAKGSRHNCERLRRRSEHRPQCLVKCHGGDNGQPRRPCADDGGAHLFYVHHGFDYDKVNAAFFKGIGLLCEYPNGGVEREVSDRLHEFSRRPDAACDEVFTCRGARASCAVMLARRVSFRGCIPRV